MLIVPKRNAVLESSRQNTREKKQVEESKETIEMIDEKEKQ